MLLLPARSLAGPFLPPSPAQPPHDLVLPPLAGRALGSPSRFDDLAAPGAVEQLGEIAVVEGDSDIVSDDGSGAVGIVVDKTRQDPIAIATRFYGAYPDDFDELIVFTTFTDGGVPGSLAYEMSVQQDVSGIGVGPGYPAKFDYTSAWGSQSGHLHAFVNMKGIADYPKYDGLAVDDPRSLLYPILGQEFAHRWVAFVHYTDRDGAVSDAMLGRDHSHWSPLLQADGSVIDGNRWVQVGNGSFDCVERGVRYSPLDLYLMGLLPPRDVPPFFLIDGATTDGGHVIDPVSDWYYCEHVVGQRQDVALSQVIAAMGPRVPSYAASPKSFRVAFLLVTRPGEKAADVLPAAGLLERVRKIWEEKFYVYSGGTGRVCTQISAPCGAAVARVQGGRVVEAGGNGNGVIEPGEPVRATFRLENDGPVDALGVSLSADADGASLSQPVTVDRIPAGGSVDVDLDGRFTAGPEACDQLFTVHATATLGAGAWKGFASTVAGAVDLYREHFDAGAGGWGVDLLADVPALADTAHKDTFAWGSPEAYSWYGQFFFQPSGGLGGAGGAWFTGPERGNIQSGVTTGVEKGTATLSSPPIDLHGALRPHVHYAGWFESIDRSRPDRLQVSEKNFLYLEVASDPLGDWHKLDELNGADDRFRPRDIDLANPPNGELCGGGPCFDPSRPVYFRFRVEHRGEPTLVEAGIDEFAVVGDAPGCGPSAPPANPDGGALIQRMAAGGCGVGGSAPSCGPFALVILLAPLLRRRSARRRRRA